jgi:hypothetical protein
VLITLPLLLSVAVTVNCKGKRAALPSLYPSGYNERTVFDQGAVASAQALRSSSWPGWLPPRETASALGGSISLMTEK